MPDSVEGLANVTEYGPRPQLFLLYNLIVHSSMNLFSPGTPGSLYSLFPKSLRHEKLFFSQF